MIPARILKFRGNRAIRSPEVAERELLRTGVSLRSALVLPVISRVIDDHIKNDPHGKRLAALLEVMRCIHQIDQILLRAEVRIDAEIVIDVVTVVCLGIVLEDR